MTLNAFLYFLSLRRGHFSYRAEKTRGFPLIVLIGVARLGHPISALNWRAGRVSSKIVFCIFYRNIAGGSGGTGAIDLPDLVESASALEKLNIDDRTLILEGLKSGKRPVKVDCGAMPAFMKAPGKCYFPRALFLQEIILFAGSRQEISCLLIL